MSYILMFVFLPEEHVQRGQRSAVSVCHIHMLQMRTMTGSRSAQHLFHVKMITRHVGATGRGRVMWVKKKRDSTVKANNYSPCWDGLYTQRTSVLHFTCASTHAVVQLSYCIISSSGVELCSNEATFKDQNTPNNSTTVLTQVLQS